MAAGSGAGAAAGAAAARWTSSFMMRPSRPVPSTEAGSMPLSAIILSAEGAFSTSRDFDGSGAFAVSAAFGSASGASAGAEAPPAITPSLPPASTVAPSLARISARVPAAGDGTSTETLSVSSSQSISSWATASPTFLNQVATVASVTLSPSAGTITSTSRPWSGADSTLSEASLPGDSGFGSVAATFFGAEPEAALAAGFASAFSSMLARRASTPTVSPSLATISESTPAEVAGTSTVTLSVSSSQSISSCATASPTFLNQVATVASVTLSPSVGTRISAMSQRSFLTESAWSTSASCCALC